MRRQPIDPARKAEALTLAEQVGAAEAARRLGLKEATIRQWRRRQKAAAPQPHAGAQARGSQAVELDEVPRPSAERSGQAAVVRTAGRDIRHNPTAHQPTRVGPFERSWSGECTPSLEAGGVEQRLVELLTLKVAQL
jgi:hypothetical protein